MHPKQFESKQRGSLFICVAALAVLLMSACEGRPLEGENPPPAARVNGLEFTQIELEREFAFDQAIYKLTNDKELVLHSLEDSLQGVIPTLVLDQQAQQAGFSATETEIEAGLAEYAAAQNFELAVLETELHRYGFTLDDFRDHYIVRAVRIEKYLDAVFRDPIMQDQDFSIWVAEQQAQADIEVLYRPPAEQPLLNGHAPNFTLKDLQGQPVSLAEYRGRPVVLNFWATWCLPCRIEMPLLQAAYRQYHVEGLTVIGINFEEGERLVAPYVAELGLTFDVLYDPNAAVGKAYQVNGLPTTFFIDRQGIIRDIQVGQVDEKKLAGTLESLIE